MSAAAAELNPPPAPPAAEPPRFAEAPFSWRFGRRLSGYARLVAVKKEKTDLIGFRCAKEAK